jgi:hypothetical protein
VWNAPFLPLEDFNEGFWPGLVFCRSSSDAFDGAEVHITWRGIGKIFVSKWDHDGDQQTLVWSSEMSLPTSSSGNMTDSDIVRNAPQVMPRACRT